jgi:lipopolysaccharide transport protein LptA
MRFPATPCLLATLLFCLPASAQTGDGPLQVVIDAESTAYDGNAGMLRFTGLKLTQGDISIESDDARSTGLDFESTTWHLVGNVVFDIEGSHIESGSADLTFEDFELQAATIAGSPATFEIRRSGTDQTTFASARRLHYDVADGVIEFSGDASITEGGNRIAAETLVYNIRERRVNAVASGAPDDRVKVTFTPPAAEDNTAGDEPAEGETKDPDDEAEAERSDQDGGE